MASCRLGIQENKLDSNRHDVCSRHLHSACPFSSRQRYSGIGSALIDTDPLGQPFINAILPVQPGFTPRFSLFHRQRYPDLSLCPSGGCCSYNTSYYGSVCRQSGYLCTGGTAAAPWCVAETSPTNECGSSNGNVRIASLSLNHLHALDNMLTFRWLSAVHSARTNSVPWNQCLLPCKKPLLLWLGQHCSVFTIVSISVASHNNL